MQKSERPEVLKREDGVDFISQMPDDILVRILSRLPSTEEVNRTSILSRRWRYVWSFVPFLDIRRRGELKGESLKEFVDWVLAKNSVDLNRFRLECYTHCSMLTLSQWIEAAVRRKVKELDLSFSGFLEDIKMPLVDYGWLEVLRLYSSSCRLHFPNLSRFSAVRVVVLQYFDLSSDSVKCFLETSPLLEELALVYCSYESDLCISCPKLKKLQIFTEDSGEFGALKISCPNYVFSY